MNYRPKVLIVDDRINNLIVLENLLKDFNVDFVRAFSGNEALAKTLNNKFALAIMDVQMPYMDGFETAQFMREDENTETLPIIFVSGFYKDNYLVIRGIEKGPVDFISKPINSKLLLNKAKVFLDLDIKNYELNKLKEELKEKKQNFNYSGIIPSKKKVVKKENKKFYEAVIITDDKGKITFWNKGAENIFEYPKDLVIGEKLSDIF